MKKFVAMYMAPTASIDAMMKNSTPADQKAGMDDWMNWANAHKENIADLGAPLGKNKRVTKAGAADVRNEMAGFSILYADSHDAATKIFTDCPHLEIPGAYVEVVEWVEMPAM
jgi:hypothetical protein